MFALILFASIALGTPVPRPPALPTRFYNRAGATGVERDADIRRCHAITTRPMTGETGNALTPPVGGPVLPRPTVQTGSDMDDCMIVRGWRLYALSAQEQAAWLRLSSRKRDRLAERLTGAPRPSWGHLIRQDTRLLLRTPDTQRR